MSELGQTLIRSLRDFRDALRRGEHIGAAFKTTERLKRPGQCDCVVKSPAVAMDSREPGVVRCVWCGGKVEGGANV